MSGKKRMRQGMEAKKYNLKLCRLKARHENQGQSVGPLYAMPRGLEESGQRN